MSDRVRLIIMFVIIIGALISCAIIDLQMFCVLAIVFLSPIGAPVLITSLLSMKKNKRGVIDEDGGEPINKTTARNPRRNPRRNIRR